MKVTRKSVALAAASVAWAMVLPAMGADVVKENNTDALNLETSWVGGVVPTAADYAVWNSSSFAGSVAMGASQTWYGVRITDLLGAAGILASNTLTLGNGGIDMSMATANFTFGNSVATVAGSNQTWRTGAGRVLTFSGALSGNNRSTVNFVPGEGTIVHTGGTVNTMVGPWAIYDNGRDFAARDGTGRIVAGRTAVPSMYVDNPTAVNTQITGADAILNMVNSFDGNSWRTPSSGAFYYGLYYNTPHSIAGRSWDQEIASGRTFTIANAASNAAANGFGILVGPDVTTPVNFNGGGFLRVGNANFLNLRQYNTNVDLTFNVNISQRATAIIEKTGPGRVIFNNEVLTTGAFNLLEGTVVVGGTAGAITGSGGVNVSSGSSLFINSTPVLGGTRAANTINVASGGLVGGTGRSLGTTVLNSGATFSPGFNGIGSPTIGSLTMQPGSNMILEFSPDGTSFDTINFASTLTINGGSVSLYQVGTTDPFNVAGLYEIATLGNPVIAGAGVSAWTVANPVSGQVYQFGTSGLTLYLSIGGIPVPNPSRWNVDQDGSWGVSGNWTAGSPDALMAIGTLGGGSVNYSGPRTVTLDGDRTVGKLNFDGTTSFTVAQGTGGALNMNNGSTAASINVLQAGAHRITAPINIQGSGLIVNVTQAGDTLTVGNMSGGSVTNIGTGTLVITGDANVSSLTITGGTVQVGDGGTTGTVGDVEVGLNTTLAFNRSDEIFLVNAYTGAGTVRFDGTGTAQLAGANTVSNYVINAGKVVVAGIGSMPANSTVTGASGELDVNSPTDVGLANIGGGIQITDSNLATSSSVIFTINGVPSLTFSGSIFESNGKTISVVRGYGGGNGQAASTWTGSSNYTGGTTLNNTEMTITNPSALGSGPVTLSSGVSGTSQRAFLAFGAPMTFANNLTVTGRNSNNTGMLRVVNADDNVTLTGNITFNVGSNQTGADIAGPTGQGLLTIAGRISATGQPLATRGNVRSTYDYVANGAEGSFSSLLIQSGRFSLGTTNAIPQNVTLDMGTNGAATFDANGFNQSFTAVTHSAANANVDTITNASATLATVTLNSPDGTTVGQANVTGNLNLVKNNTGIQQLGNVVPGGSVTVNGGGLILAGAANATTNVVRLNASSVSLAAGTTVTLAVVADRPTNKAGVAVFTMPSLPSAVIELNNNDAIFRGPSEASVVAQVAAWYNQGGRDGVSNIMSATAGGSGIDNLATLAVTINDKGDGTPIVDTFDGLAVTISDVLVKYTYFGDTDLNGIVDGNDMSNLIRGLRNGLSGWYNGDTNYDGVVDSNDMANLLKVMSLQGAASFGDSGAPGVGGAVPEPAALGLVLAGLPMVARRRRA